MLPHLKILCPGWGYCPTPQRECCHPQEGHPMGHLPQGRAELWILDNNLTHSGRSSHPWGWREQRDEDWWHLLLGCRLHEGSHPDSCSLHSKGSIRNWWLLRLTTTLYSSWSWRPMTSTSRGWLMSPVRLLPTWSKVRSSLGIVLQLYFLGPLIYNILNSK